MRKGEGIRDNFERIPGAGFFIPFVSLWRPYQVVTEIWRASDPDFDVSTGVWQSASLSPLVGTWWLFWLISWHVGQIVARYNGGSGFESHYLTENWLNLASSLIDIIAAVLALMVVRTIAARQDEKHRRQGGLRPLVA